MIMLIARALLAKIRPPRLNPRELQDQVDVTRAAVLTSAYALARQQEHKPEGGSSFSYEQLEREIAAIKPLAKKRRVQLALNDQVSIRHRTFAVQPRAAADVETNDHPTTAWAAQSSIIVDKL